MGHLLVNRLHPAAVPLSSIQTDFFLPGIALDFMHVCHALDDGFLNPFIHFIFILIENGLMRVRTRGTEQLLLCQGGGFPQHKITVVNSNYMLISCFFASRVSQSISRGLLSEQISQVASTGPATALRTGGDGHPRRISPDPL